MRKLTKTAVFALVLVATSLIGCKKEVSVDGTNCIKGEGSVITKTLSVNTFKGIDLTFASDVKVKQGSTQEVKAIGHANIIDKIETAVSNDIWKIALENGCYNNYKLKLEITVPTINSLDITGSGNIEVEDFTNQSSLKANITGSGNISLAKFEGITNLDVSLAGSGDFKANNDISSLDALKLDILGSGKYSGFAISSNKCTVKSSGSGNAEVKAINTLNVTITGSGDVYYKGTPTKTENVTGSGRVIDAN